MGLKCILNLLSISGFTEKNVQTLNIRKTVTYKIDKIKCPTRTHVISQTNLHFPTLFSKGGFNKKYFLVLLVLNTLVLSHDKTLDNILCFRKYEINRYDVLYSE